MSSGWLDCIKPSLTTSLQGKQGVQHTYLLIRGGSRTDVKPYTQNSDDWMKSKMLMLYSCEQCKCYYFLIFS